MQTEALRPQKHGHFSDNNSSKKACSRTIIFDWHKRFWEGRADISDDFWSIRLRISDSAKNIQIAASRYIVPE